MKDTFFRHNYILTLLFVVLLSNSSVFSAINKYGMSITGTVGNYTLTNATNICPLITGGCAALPADAYLEYAGYVPSLINDNDYAQCTTTSYTLFTYPTYTLNLKVDIPKLTTGPHPFIVWVHGGGWTGGNEENFSNQSKYLASRGIAGVRITYSLIAEGGNFDLGMQELDSAFRFVKAHAAEWGLDITKFGYAGGSAGTPLSSLAAMKHNANGNACKLYIGCNGIYDFQKNLAGAFGSGANTYLNAYPTKESRNVISAINFIPNNPANVPAVVVYHGTADYTISHLQSVALCDSIAKKGGRAEKNIYNYYVHAFFNTASSDKYEDVTLKMYSFAKSVFGTPDVVMPVTEGLLGQYDFTTGANQLKASNVAAGIAMGDIVVGTGSSPITSTFTGDAIETSNWQNYMNIAVGKCVNLSITKHSNAAEFNVSKIVVTLKRTTPTKFQINYGSAANTTSYRTYAAATLHGTNSYTPISFTENINTGNTGVTVSAIPAVTDGTTQFIAIGTMYASTSSAAEVVSIDKIEVFGTVKLATREEINNVNSIKVWSSYKSINIIGLNQSDLKIFDISGLIVFQKNKISNNYRITNLKQGIYFINIDNSYKQKIIIQ
jgi:acetyl esterase/lipase